MDEGRPANRSSASRRGEIPVVTPILYFLLWCLFGLEVGIKR